MTAQSDAIAALRATLTATPAPLAAPLRRHLAELLLETNAFAEAEEEFTDLLRTLPNDPALKFGLARACFHQQKWMVASVLFDELLRGAATAEMCLLAARTYVQSGERAAAAGAYQRAIMLDPAMADPDLAARLADVTPAPPAPASDTRVRVLADALADAVVSEVEKPQVNFADVGGMEKLKEEIRLKIIHPLNHPELYRAYGKRAGGGILMYGPPGCGKTHLARATTGEVQAAFLAIGIHDVLNMYLGQSEANLHELFETARRNAPCVLFIDEIDALGANRTDMRQTAGRQVINQLLAELDGLDGNNEGVLVLAATNAPWHLDPALRRPGRFDRIIFVPPPDAAARADILRILLRDKPQGALDFTQLAERSEGFSGADLKGLVDATVEGKLQEAFRTGAVQPLQTKDVLHMMREAKPSTVDWFATARNYALYANQSGLYNDVLNYIQKDAKADRPRFAFWRDR